MTTSKSKRDPVGQKGVMSSLFFNPDMSKTFAIGTYANSVGIYTEDDLECVLEIRDLDFGVSHIRWSPCGNHLWLGGRRHDDICCWDVRSTRCELGRFAEIDSTPPCHYCCLTLALYSQDHQEMYIKSENDI